MIRARFDGAFAARLTFPWWAGVTAAAAAYVFCGFVIPSLMTGYPALSRLGGWLVDAAPLCVLTLVGVSVYALIRRRGARRLRQTHNQLESMRSMDWQNFELMVAEGFRRLGYAVDNRGWYVPNSPVHISLQKNGGRTLVECRQWQVREIGVGPVRELYRTMTTEHADGALLVTSGTFSPEAQEYVSDKPIGLIDGDALLELVQTVQPDVTDEECTPAPQCPVCERPMTRRKAGRASTIGQVYWGCIDAPRCLGTRQV